MLEKKTVQVKYGTMSYFVAKNELRSPTLVYIHGLGGLPEDWLVKHYLSFELREYSWIVPLLMGYPGSDSPQDPKAYIMRQYASDVLEVLKKESLSDLIVVGHSMGGPIAVHLLEQISEMKDKPTVRVLVYLEGNLDFGDCFGSSKVISEPLDVFTTQVINNPERFFDKPSEGLRMALQTGSLSTYALWHSSVDLVSESTKGYILSRIQSLEEVSYVFLFGGRNKGRYSSEKFVIGKRLPTHYYPNAGHDPMTDNPEEFWPFFKELMTSFV